MNGQSVDGVEIQEATNSETLQAASSTTSTARGSLPSTGSVSSVKDTSLGPSVMVTETEAKQYTIKVTNISKGTMDQN